MDNKADSESDLNLNKYHVAPRPGSLCHDINGGRDGLEMRIKRVETIIYLAKCLFLYHFRMQSLDVGHFKKISTLTEYQHL